MTTYEHFRHRYSNTGNPYSRGLWKNFGQVLCTKVPPRWEPLWEKQRAEDDEMAAADVSEQHESQSQSQQQQQVNNGGAIGDNGICVDDDGSVSNFLPNYHDGSVVGGSPTISSYTLDDGYDDSDGNSSSSMKCDDGHVMTRCNNESNGLVDLELGALPKHEDEGDFSTPVQTPRNRGGTLSPAAIESAAATEDVAALEFLQSPRPPVPPPQQPPYRGQ